MNKNLRHSFIPGDEWLYFKIGCGVVTGDRLLKNEIFRLINDLKENDIIEKWFFVRMPKELRVRLFLGENSSYLGFIIKQFNEILKSKFDQDLIEKVEIKTYQRELQRYTEDNIVFCENIFCLNSDLVINYLCEENNINDMNRIFLSLHHIDTILEEFDNKLEDKQLIVSDYLNAYLKEFRSNKHLKKQLMKKYERLAADIKNIFFNKEEGNSFFSELDLNVSSGYKENINSIKKNISNKVQLIQIQQSLMHMFINRLFYSEQRKYELLIYYLLSRYYAFKVNIGKTSSNY